VHTVFVVARQALAVINANLFLHHKDRKADLFLLSLSDYFFVFLSHKGVLSYYACIISFFGARMAAHVVRTTA
jgi:hypothetical protein